AYNPLTTRYVTSEIACSYDAESSRHIGVQKALESRAILSVCGELYKGNNMVQILTSEIEWNYTYSTNKGNVFLENTSNSNKKRNQHLMSYEDRYQNKKPKVQQTKVIVNENNEHSEEQNPTNESENKTPKENDDNINSKSNMLKSAMKKTMKK
ncbi:12182_t:CDS:1, partial [Racocetra fulgida]